MSQILRSKLVTTKTPHKCWGCAKEYPAKTRMEFRVCVDMGKVFSIFYCPTCLDYLNKTQYFSQGDEVCFGELCQNYDYPEGELQMIREIEFRGKKIDTGVWVYGNYAYSEVTGKHQITVETLEGCKHYYVYHPVIPETVGQYTGLKDKNGKEIYEGDIVAFEDCTSTESGYYELNCVGEVLWDLETVSFCVSNRLMAESYEVLEECLVIGNIYDNPELLKEVK